MEGQSTILCYWNGKIEEGKEGAQYAGGTTSVLCIPASISFVRLLEKLHSLTSFPKHTFDIQIVGRLLAHSSPRLFVSVPIQNMEVLHALCRSDESRGSCTELYIEDERIFADAINEPAFSMLDVVNDRVTESSKIATVESATGNSDANALDMMSFIVAAEDQMCHEDNYISTNIQETDVEVLESYDAVIEYEECPHDDFVDLSHFQNAVNGQCSNNVQSPTCDIYKGQQFVNKEHLVNHVLRYNLQVFQSYRVKVSNKSQLSLQCDRCHWELRAWVIKGGQRFHVTYYSGPHTCLNPCLSTDHFNMGSTFVAQEIEELVRAQLNISVAAIIAHIGLRFHYQISYKKAWLGKQKAITNLFGGWVESFKILPQWLNQVVRANPGTAVVWRKDPGDVPGKEIFVSVFWSFGPSIQAFKHCRPVISVDGTHLYGKYNGTLLIVVAVDADDMILPIAFAVVDKESKDSWTWFMACFREKVCPTRKLCVVSDRHIGIRTAMRCDGWTQPRAYHRFCLRHMASNFQHKFGDTNLKDAIHKAALENQMCKFNTQMDTVELINPEARAWWEKVPLDQWALCHDGGHRYGITTTNLSESFNNVMKGARSLPITALVQLSFYRLNKYFDYRRQSCERMKENFQTWTDMATKKLKKSADSASRHHVERFDHQNGVFSVRTGHRSGLDGVHKGGHTQVVNLKKKQCSCNKWQIYGIPCSHAIAACASANIDYSPLVSSWYGVAALQRTYSHTFNPIVDKRYWQTYEGEELIPDPNAKRVKPGRPKSTRLRNEMDCKEKGTPNSCSSCKGLGHNTRTCHLSKKRKAINQT